MNKKSALINLFEAVKSLKSNRVYIAPNSMILGANEDYSVFKKLEVRNPMEIVECMNELGLRELTFIHKDMSLFVRHIKAEDNPMIDIDIYSNKIIYENICVDINNGFQLYTFNNKFYQFINNIANSMIDIQLDDVRPYLTTYDACKSAEKTTVKIDRNHMMIMHGSMLPINKSDKVGLNIYSMSKNVSIWIYNIMKPKQTISVYTYCLNI